VTYIRMESVSRKDRLRCAGVRCGNSAKVALFHGDPDDEDRATFHPEGLGACDEHLAEMSRSMLRSNVFFQRTVRRIESDSMDMSNPETVAHLAELQKELDRMEESGELDEEKPVSDVDDEQADWDGENDE
jgi:hypothetical protein